MTTPIIHVDALCKTFRTTVVKPGMMGALKGLVHRERRDVAAVTDISFDIHKGEMVGYIGANGAGKSTTIKMLTGILLPTSGVVEVAGYVPFKERRQYVREIGVVFGQRTQLWWDLAVEESFNLLGKIYEIPDAQFRQRLGFLVEMLELGDKLRVPVRKMSLGERMRADLVAALLHNPRILFLDEPTIGLDVVGKSRVRAFLQELRDSEKVTVLLTTHDLDEIEQLCPRIIIIDHGRKVFDGDLPRLLESRSPTKKIIVDFESPPPDGRFQALTGRGIKVTMDGDARGEFVFNRNEVASGELLKWIAELHPLRDLRIEEPGIEDVVSEIYAHQGTAPR